MVSVQTLGPLFAAYATLEVFPLEAPPVALAPRVTSRPSKGASNARHALLALALPLDPPHAASVLGEPILPEVKRALNVPRVPSASGMATLNVQHVLQALSPLPLVLPHAVIAQPDPPPPSLEVNRALNATQVPSLAVRGVVLALHAPPAPAPTQAPAHAAPVQQGPIPSLVEVKRARNVSRVPSVSGTGTLYVHNVLQALSPSPLAPPHAVIAQPDPTPLLLGVRCARNASQVPSLAIRGAVRALHALPAPAPTQAPAHAAPVPQGHIPCLAQVKRARNVPQVLTAA